MFAIITEKGGGGGAVSVSSTKSLSGHLRDVFCPIFAHFNLSLQLFPFPSPPVPQVGGARFPSGLSLAERADEVSIDLILWKTYWQRPEKARPGTKSSLAHFFPKVSTRRKTEKHNYSSYWLIFFFFFLHKQRDRLNSGTKGRDTKKKERGGSRRGHGYQGKPEETMENNKKKGQKRK